MNNNDFSDSDISNSSYRATSNLNSAIENPMLNINDAENINLMSTGDDSIVETSSKDGDFDSFSSYQGNDFSSVNQNDYDTSLDYQKIDSVDNNKLNSQFVTQDSLNNSEDTSYYEPVMEGNKKSNVKITFPKELGVVVFIVLILVIFVLLIPYIYDFFKNSHFIISG